MPDIALSLLDSNPYRDFDLHPIDQEQVDRLKASIGADGFWASVVARKVGNRYEIAFGHHRIEAARQRGDTVAPIEVRDLSDRQMVRMLASENATQRGSTTAAALDAVQAICRVLAYDLLRWDEAMFARFHANIGISYHECRGRIEAGSGIGTSCVKAFAPEGAFTEHQIRIQLAVLKESGRMADIIDKARAAADGELRAEQEAAERELTKAQENEAAAKTKREREAASKNLNKAKKAAAKSKKATDATGKAVAAAKERQPVIYDARCAQLFKLESHAEVFRRIVTGETFQSYLKLNQQFAFAKSVLASLRENMPNKEVTSRDIRVECWSRIETGLGMAKGKMRTAPERPYLEEIKEGLNMLRRAEGDFKRGVALLIRGFTLGERLNPKQVERLNAIEATFDAGWDGMKPYRQAKPTLKLVEGE